jgi:hypothetical protein
MILPFLDDSGRWSNDGIMTTGLMRQTLPDSSCRASYETRGNGGRGGRRGNAHQALELYLASPWQHAWSK